jgi:hypothetical protein
VVIKRRNQSQKKKRKGVDLRDLKVNSEALFQISNHQEVLSQHKQTNSQMSYGKNMKTTVSHSSKKLFIISQNQSFGSSSLLPFAQ